MIKGNINFNVNIDINISDNLPKKEIERLNDLIVSDEFQNRIIHLIYGDIVDEKDADISINNFAYVNLHEE